MNDTLTGPDLTKGFAISAIADGSMILGHALGEPVLFVRRGDEFFDGKTTDQLASFVSADLLCIAIWSVVSLLISYCGSSLLARTV
jgi:hypothetical protein